MECVGGAKELSKFCRSLGDVVVTPGTVGSVMVGIVVGIVVGMVVGSPSGSSLAGCGGG